MNVGSICVEPLGLEIGPPDRLDRVDVHAQLLDRVLGLRCIGVEPVVLDRVGEVVADRLEELRPHGAVGRIDDQGFALAVLGFPQSPLAFSNSAFWSAPLLADALGLRHGVLELRRGDLGEHAVIAHGEEQASGPA